MTIKSPEAIEDWNDAYDNIGHIPNALSYFDLWTKHAQDFVRESSSNSASHFSCELDLRYGPKERQIYDLFTPQNNKEQPIKGIFVFIHGGYWYRFDKSYFSHLAEGPLSKGYIVAMPSYTLCPTVKVSDITQEITVFIETLVNQERFSSNLPIVLCGHSAGGHLVTRQLCYDETQKPILDPSILKRLKQVISISGVHDLRPILRIVQNEQIQLSVSEAWKESPALLEPVELKPESTDVICLVGDQERPEFIRQNDLVANIWKGMGISTTSIHVSGKHHFNVVDDLIDPKGIICSMLP